MQANKIKRWLNKVGYFVFILIASTIIICICYHNTMNTEDVQLENANQESIEILKRLEEVSVNDILTLIESKQMSVDNIVVELEPDEIDFKKYFESSIFMGDSMVEAFRAYDYLDSSSVVAKVGLRLATANAEVQTIINLNPKEVFLLFGANDLLVYQTPELYIKEYESLIDDIKVGLPHVKISVISIFPVREDVTYQTPNLSLERVTTYNQELIKMCERLGYDYIDVGSYVTEEMYEPDGIHVKAKFYPIWMEIVKGYKEESI